jgi:hypothetical protein
MNKQQTIAKLVEIFGKPWDELKKVTKDQKMEYERLLNSPKRSDREKSIGFHDGIESGRVRLFYTNNENAQGGKRNGGGKGWYVSFPKGSGMMYGSELLESD